MSTQYNYITHEELEEYADIVITDDTEADDRIRQAEEIINAYVGPQNKAFPYIIEGIAVSADALTLTMQVDQQNIYEIDQLIYCVCEILGGTGSGQRRRVAGQTKEGVLTFDESWITTPDTTSFYRIYQIGKFPRIQDQSYYSYATPYRYFKVIPEAVKRAVVAQIQYMIEMGDSFFTSNDADKKRERIGDYEYENYEAAGGSGSLTRLIAPKAKMYLRGITNRKGVIIR